MKKSITVILVFLCAFLCDHAFCNTDKEGALARLGDPLIIYYPDNKEFEILIYLNKNADDRSDQEYIIAKYDADGRYVNMEYGSDATLKDLDIGSPDALILKIPCSEFRGFMIIPQ